MSLWAEARRGPWLFSAPVDIAVFGGSAALSFALLWLGAALGVLHGDTPDWGWIPAVLLVDVAHVWATSFRVYLDLPELKRRPWLYALVPVIGYGLGVALHSEGERVFWRSLAYVAVFHFVRQQYGWVALYRAKARETGAPGKWIDGSAIYLATLYPLAYWHAHLPRGFWWFLKGDFAPIPTVICDILRPLYWLALGVYACRSLWRAMLRGELNPGKDLVVATTALCWHVGIIGLNSDYAFTVTNVIIHGVPYFALVWAYARARRAEGTSLFRALTANPFAFLAALWLAAYAEEMLWDRGIWKEREWLFGASWDLGAWKAFVVPLLALPQITHYVLDGFVWRRRSNPEMGVAGLAGEAAPARLLAG